MLTFCECARNNDETAGWSRSAKSHLIRLPSDFSILAPNSAACLRPIQEALVTLGDGQWEPYWESQETDQMVARSWTSSEIYFLYEADGIGQVLQAHGLFWYIHYTRKHGLVFWQLRIWQAGKAMWLRDSRALQTNSKSCRSRWVCVCVWGGRNDSLQAPKGILEIWPALPRYRVRHGI